MKTVLCKKGISEVHQAAISAQANLLQQVKPRRGGRSQNTFTADMNTKLIEPSVSAQALVPVWGNLRMQVKPRSGGRSQNSLMRGLPI